MLQNHTLQLLQVAAEIQQRRQELLRERLEPQIQTIQAYLERWTKIVLWR